MTSSLDTRGGSPGEPAGASSGPGGTTGLPASALRAAIRALARGLAALETSIAYALYWRQAHWLVEQLSALDDAALKDLGLDRNEIVPRVYDSLRAGWEKRRRTRRGQSRST